MFYEEAGPTRPGAVDVSILILADTFALSLQAGASAGDDRYGGYDRVPRGDLAWQAPIGHVEFRAIDNLAKYGWDECEQGGYSSAAGLSYVLHALSGVCAPHHVTGTTSWGH